MIPIKSRLGELYSKIKIDNRERFGRELECGLDEFFVNSVRLKESARETIEALRENGWDADKVTLGYVIYVKKKEPS